MERSESPAFAVPDAEARHATILKCDLVSSTRTKKLLDLGAQLEFKRWFEKVVTSIANLHGASIEQFEGDGALIVLGFPHPREDAAEAAIRMGLDLINAVHNAEVVPNLRLQLRVGVASGLIAIVKWPAGSKSEAIAGLTIDIAERLRALAEPDQLVITDSTKRLAAGFFHYDDLGTIPCKGFDEGVKAWKVLGASPVVSRFEAQHIDASRNEIIGRAEVLAALSQAWGRAVGGHGETICLVGDAGIGKSRLAQAVLEAVVRDGAAAIRIDCTPSTGNTPLFPIGVMLRRIAEITTDTSDDEKRTLAERLLGRLLPSEAIGASLSYLAPLFGLDSMATPADVNPAELREQTILTLARIFNGLAAQQPLAVVCEDLHWGDDSTVNFLARYCSDIGQQRALMIVTLRPSAEEPPLDPSRCRIIELQPLGLSAAADLVHSVAKAQSLPSEIVNWIVNRSEGLPLLLEEVTRNILEGATSPDSAFATTAPGGDVPPALQLVVQTRLSRWPLCAPLAQSAAVLGRDFSRQLLERVVSASPGSEVNDMIDLLAREGLFADPSLLPHDRARFKHIMICDAVYNTLLSSDKKRLHSKIADILSQDGQGIPDAAPDVVAEHLRKAGRFVEAIRMRLAESTHTAARGAYVEAEGHCTAALTLIDEVEDAAERKALQFRLLVQLGVALTGQHGYSAVVVEDAYRRAHAACGDEAEAEILYPIIRGLATVNLVRGNLPTAFELSVQGLQLAEQSNRAEFLIDAMSVLCYTTLYYGRLDDCRSWIDRCLQLYRTAGGSSLRYPVPQDAGTAALAVLPTVAWMLGDAEGAEDAVHEGLVHVERLDRDFDRALLHAWIAGARYTQRRYDEALEHASLAMTISQRNGYREWYATGALMALLAQSALRADPGAVAQATQVCMEFAREGVGLNASYYLWGLALGYAKAGDPQMARSMLAEAFRRATVSQETRMTPELLMLQAELDPDDAKAQVLLSEALSLAEEQRAIPTILRAGAGIVIRARRNEADSSIAFARQTLDILDGRSTPLPEKGWMLQRSRTLRRMLKTRQRTAALA